MRKCAIVQELRIPPNMGKCPLIIAASVRNGSRALSHLARSGPAAARHSTVEYTEIYAAGQPNNVTASKLAVDGEVQKREIADAVCNFEPHAD